MTKAYNNSLLARNISISGVNTNISGVLQLNDINVSVSGHTHTSSNITDFNTTVSGLLPVKNILAGNNITISSSSGTYTINSAGGGGSSSTTVRGNVITSNRLSSFNVSGGYSVGYLDIFQNGVKLLSGSDFTATDGTSVTLSNSVPSGTVLEYISLGASVSSSNYTKLDNISSSFNGSSTSFGLAVSGIAYYPVSANTLGIYVGGVAQEPISSYSVSGSNIVFTEAPASGLTFWGVGYGTTAAATLNGIVPGSVSSPAISSSNDLATGFYFPSSGSLAIASSGYDRFKIDTSGNAYFGGQNIDTLRYVDINNINNSSNAGSILRLITTNVSGTSNVSVDIAKYKNGTFVINNGETNSAASTSFGIGGSERLRITSSGNVGIGTSVPTTLLDINNNKFRVRNSKTPSSPSDIGNQGDICWDSSYIYVCTSANSWTRTPISAWSSDPYFSYVSLLLHMDGTDSTFVDASLTPKTVTANGNATQSAAQSRWGGKSAFFNGTGDSLSFPDVGIGTSDFTIEMWLKTASSVQYAQLIGNETSGGSEGFSLLINNDSASGGQIALYRSGMVLASSSGDFSDDQWHYIAVSRSGSTMRLYIDGTLRSTGTSSANFSSSAATFVARNNAFYPRNLVGYIDDLRITVGSARGYTGSTIPVPTAAFPDYNT
jgi:hypothetical protein